MYSQHTATERTIGYWLFILSVMIFLLIAFGGLVRLTRSGLSIVEWNVITGIIPPLNEMEWQLEFAKYQNFPEYKHINFGMSLNKFKFIYHMEFWHRFFGRVIGLSYILPLFYFIYNGAINFKNIMIYIGIGLLFMLQGIIGWLMVKSGLNDIPSVSHIRLTMHLMGALALLSACLWMSFKYLLAARISQSTLIRKVSALTLFALCLQIAAGGLVAGLKAGHISNTFPLMFGEWTPNGLLNLQPIIVNLVENPATVHFQHRWFGFVILGLAIILFFLGRKQQNIVRKSTNVALCICLIQIGLGIATVLGSVPIILASLHQITAIALFTTVLLTYRCT